MTRAVDRRVHRAYRTRPTLRRDEGSGPAVVFAHGTLMDRTMFDPQVDALSDDHRCIAYDLRARTENHAEPYDLDDLADDLEALLDGQDVDRCVLVGMSMGGFMGLRFALRHPDRLDGLVLVDSMAGVHDDVQIQSYEAMLDEIRGDDEVPEALARTSASILFGETTRENRPELVEDWTERWTSYPPEAVVNEVESWLHRDDVTDRLDEITLPVLALHGDQDVSITVEDARETVEGLPDAELRVIEDAGHSSNLERPESANEALKSFLSDVY